MTNVTAEFKFGRARATLTSIMPYCANNHPVVLGICEICGTVKGFTFQNSVFPDSGYYTECRACQSWTMFYKIGLAKIERNYTGNTERFYERRQDIKVAEKTIQAARGKIGDQGVEDAANALSRLLEDAKT